MSIDNQDEVIGNENRKNLSFLVFPLSQKVGSIFLSNLE